MNRLLIGVFALLIVYVAGCYILVGMAIPTYLALVDEGAVPTIVMNGREIASNALLASEAAARYDLALNLVIAAGFIGAGALILWKAQNRWFRWLTAFVLFFFPLGALDSIVRMTGFGYDYFLAGSLLWPAFLLFLYLFPDGRAVPGWSRWPMLIVLGTHLFAQTVVLASYWTTVAPWLWQIASTLFVVVLLGFVMILACQVYRYRVVSTATERAQVKWFVAALAAVVVSMLVNSLPSGAVLQSAPGFGADISNLAYLLIPLSITIAILHYRLWDIDVVIRKTLLYTVTTALLALLFFGSVILLQRVFEAVTGQQSQAAIVLSTLAIAALFNPLRTRIQAWIDRRPYRKKYDVQQVLARFAITARDETNMNALTAELARVVRETLQPEHAGIWLRLTGKEKQR